MYAPIPKLQLKVIFPTEVNDPRVSTIKLLQESISSGFSRKPKYGLLPVTSPKKLGVYILKSNSLLASKEFDFKIYTPSFFGLVTGNNPYLGLRENPDEIDSCSNFMVETRGSFTSVGKMTFSWSFGMGAYIENYLWIYL